MSLVSINTNNLTRNTRRDNVFDITYKQLLSCVKNIWWNKYCFDNSDVIELFPINLDNEILTPYVSLCEYICPCLFCFLVNYKGFLIAGTTGMISPSYARKTITPDFLLWIESSLVYREEYRHLFSFTCVRNICDCRFYNVINDTAVKTFKAAK